MSTALELKLFRDHDDEISVMEAVGKLNQVLLLVLVILSRTITSN